MTKLTADQLEIDIFTDRGLRIAAIHSALCWQDQLDRFESGVLGDGSRWGTDFAADLRSYAVRQFDQAGRDGTLLCC